MSYHILPQIPYNDTFYKLINPFFTNITEDNTVKINQSLFNFLAEIKCDIDRVPTEWDNMKKYTNQYEFIHTNIPGTKHPVSKLKPLSRSYYKMIEICKLLNIVDTETKRTTPITSFHFAEGPGGFVEALCELRKNKDDKYYAMTLQDKNDLCVPGWRKSKQFLENNENVIIEHGITEDGDLLKNENLSYCYEKCKNMCELVTGDGGFDFSIDFNNQEIMSSNLVFSQIAYAIACQKKGGHFILKVFDTFTDITVDLIYLLSNVYENVFIVKPISSRPANSEKYIVCKNFRVENTKEYMKIFIDILSKLSENIVLNRLFKEKIPIIFLNRMEEINAIYGQQQIESIVGTLSLIKKVKNNYSEKYKLDKLKANNIAKCIAWCQKYGVPHNKTFNTNNFIHSQN